MAISLRSWILKRPVFVTATVEHVTSGPRERVWDLLEPPERSVGIDAGVVLAGRLPGAPQGVGEIQYFVHEDDGVRSLGAVEVLEVDPGRRAFYREIGTTCAFHVATEMTLADVDDDQVLVRHVVSVELRPRPPRWLVEHARSRMSATADYLERSVEASL